MTAKRWHCRYDPPNGSCSMCSDLNRHDPEVIGGILNGAPPFRAEMSPEADFSILWVVLDSEDSVVARVDSGEEMAIFFAAELNRLASVPEYANASADPDSANSEGK